MSAKKGQHHCTRCGSHRGPMKVFRKKSGIINGRPFNLCRKCAKEYVMKMEDHKK